MTNGRGRGECESLRSLLVLRGPTENITALKIFRQ